MEGNTFPKPTLGVYGAGCTGFVLTSNDVTVVPVAPSKVPMSSESKTRKNDHNDAAKLARLALAGELHEVWVAHAFDRGGIRPVGPGRAAA